MADAAPLSVAYTPDSDDAFAYYAWEHGKVALGDGGPPPTFHREPITALNAAALEGRFDVVAVSSAFYPLVAERYWILAVGSSVTRGRGPVLASKRFSTVAELRGRRVAVAGLRTTGGLLARLYCPGVELAAMRYDAIADAVARGETDAGVMIHEEQIVFADAGLRLACDLGRAWLDDTGLPLPVGINLVRKTLGVERARAIATACQQSLVWAFAHAAEAYAFAGRFGRGQARRHVELFSQADTLRLPDDARRALRVVFDRAGILGGPRLGAFDIVDGAVSAGDLPAAAHGRPHAP